MVKFSIRSLLILIALVALWSSTIAGYESANDVRTLLMLSIVVASGVAATKYDGPRRAFWVGFLLTVLTARLDDQSHLSLPWVESLLNENGVLQNLPNGNLNHRYFFARSTIHISLLLLIATAMGLLGVVIYGADKREK